MIWLDNARIFAVFTVILLHVSARFVTENDVGSELWWIGNLYDSIARWCVPVLVMISGALLLDPEKKEDIEFFYRKRIYRILLPILFWSALFLFWGFLKGVLNGQPPTTLSLVKKLLYGTPYYHMWFLYMITSLYIFTPYLRKIVTASTEKELLFLISVMFVYAAASSAYRSIFSVRTMLFINWFLSYLPYFFLGYLIRQSRNRPRTVALWVMFLLSFVFTFLGCYFVSTSSGLRYGLYFYGALSLTVIPMSISIMYLLKRWTSPVFNEKITRKLSVLTLGVYLIHPLIIEALDSFKNHTRVDEMLSTSIFLIPMMAAIVFITSSLGAWIIYQVPYLKRTI